MQKTANNSFYKMIRITRFKKKGGNLLSWANRLMGRMFSGILLRKAASAASDKITNRIFTFAEYHIITNRLWQNTAKLFLDPIGKGVIAMCTGN
jgi:hypothetical protein